MYICGMKGWHATNVKISSTICWPKTGRIAEVEYNPTCLSAHYVCVSYYVL